MAERKVCTYFLENRCTYGEKCRNSHQIEQTHYEKPNETSREEWERDYHVIKELSPGEYDSFIDVFYCKEYVECSNEFCGRKASRITNKKITTCCSGCRTLDGHTKDCNLNSDLMKYG